MPLLFFSDLFSEEAVDRQIEESELISKLSSESESNQTHHNSCTKGTCIILLAAHYDANVVSVLKRTFVENI